ncbi:MAG: di-trans,poly-cis-decaprenylcistransferase [Thermoprotei archaeon]|nr:MAG: di-trans,poly-cis-decaprenylcistransferase [Thermoprotei archaeon]
MLSRVLRYLLKSFLIYELYERLLIAEIKKAQIPTHVAIILDGNRRWAKKHGMEPWYGHLRGAEKAEEVLDWCLELGIKIITMYVLSTENLKRDKKELNKLFEIIEEYLRKALNNEKIHRYEVRIKAIGKLNLLPMNIRELIEELEEKTSKYDSHYLNIAIAYGGRSEIIEAVKKIAKDVKTGKVKVDEIDEETFEHYLFTSHLPKQSPDLVIRTSGEVRLSNFLLWQSAYSELIFMDVYWPEFRKIDLLRAIRLYQQRHRRFGR